MSRYIVRRLLQALVVMFGVSVFAFALVHLVPGDPIRTAMGTRFDQQAYDLLRERHGFDQPLPVQYVTWLASAITGDLGVSFRSGRPVTTVLLGRLPATLSLAFASIVVALLIAIPLGILSAQWDRFSGVVRPVIFMAYSGEMRWRTRAGDELAARLGEPLTQDALSQAWRAALDPKGDWIKKVLQAADRRLTEVRKTHADAGGLVIASDHENARAYSRILRQITGKGATVVLSDDPTASKKITRFAKSDDRWMVAVRMVSEGVDVPRLMVGVYATSTSTALFFAQAIGRFVRVRKRGEVASVFLPSVPTLLEYAGEMERERDHVLDKTPSEDDEYPEEDLLKEANKKKDTPDAGEELPFETMESAAEFDRALYDGLEYGGGAAGSSEEEDFLGLPGLLDPEQVSQLLRKRKADIHASQRKARGKAEPEEESGPTHEVLAELRKELSNLVGAWHHRTGKPHGVIHNELRRACGGPPVAQASPPQIRERIAKLRAWAVGQK